jgi:hypothetical protein
MSNLPEPPAKRTLDKEVPAQVRERLGRESPRKTFTGEAELTGSSASGGKLMITGKVPSAFFDRFALPTP